MTPRVDTVVVGVVIDLGEVQREPPLVSGRPLVRGRRLPLAAFALVLLALLGGAAVSPRELQPALVPARLGDAMFVEADRVHLISAAGLVSTYALPGGRLLSRTPVAVTGPVYQVSSSGAALLVSYQVNTLGEDATVAVQTGTPRELWRVPARLLTFSRADNLAVVRLRNDSWYGVDLETGQRKWELQQPALGYTTMAAYAAGFPQRLVTVAATGHLEVRDTVSGTMVAQADVPAKRSWPGQGVSVWPAGDLVLVGGLGGVTAYGINDLTVRWTTSLDLTRRYVQPDCAGAVCVISFRGGLQVIDPATGALRWSSLRWNGADAIGKDLLVYGGEGLEARYPLAVVNTATGDLIRDYGPWRPAGPVRTDGSVVVLRQRIGADTVHYGLLNPQIPTVRIMGAAADVSGDCQATRDVLVCRRIDAAVAIWPLRLPGR